MPSMYILHGCFVEFSEKIGLFDVSDFLDFDEKATEDLLNSEKPYWIHPGHNERAALWLEIVIYCAFQSDFAENTDQRKKADYVQSAAKRMLHVLVSKTYVY